MFASTYPLLDVFISTLYFAILIFWIILIFHIMLDIFRSHDLSGGLVYLVIRGGSMHERQLHAVQAQQKSFEDYIRKVANSKE